MAFGTTSSLFRAFLADALAATANFTPQLSTGGTWKCALYGDTGTPDNDVTAANSAYNAGQWVNTSEIVDVTNWVAGGRALAWGSATRWSQGADYSMFDADDCAGGGTLTVAGVMGDLIYNDGLTTPVADQALCYHAYGSAKAVTGGTFTVQFHANGVARWTTTAA